MSGARQAANVSITRAGRSSPPAAACSRSRRLRTHRCRNMPSSSVAASGFAREREMLQAAIDKLRAHATGRRLPARPAAQEAEAVGRGAEAITSAPVLLPTLWLGNIYAIAP